MAPSPTPRDFNEWMTDAVDDRLSSSERLEFEALLAESDERRAEWDGFRAMREDLRSIGTEAAPAELTERVAAAIRQSGHAGAEPPPSSWSHLRQLGWVRAAAVIAVFFGVAFLAPLIAQSMEAAGTAAPFGATPLQVGLATGFTLGVVAKLRGTWI